MKEKLERTPITNKNLVSFEYGLLPYADLPNIVLLMCKDSQDKKWKPVGTAFPVFHNNIITLVTAAHVVKNLQGLPVKAINYPYEISLDHFQTLYMDTLDIACIQCNSEDLANLFKICHCIKPSDNYAIAADMETTFCQVFGYPQSKNKYSPNEPFVPHATRLSLGKQNNNPLKSKSKLSQLGIPLLQFDLNIKNLVNNKFERSNQLSVLKGISGGPVINYSTTSGLGSLIGIFIEWDKESKTAVILPWAVISMFLSKYAS